MSDHTDVGAYSLGLLEQADREAFEDHLAGCESCAAELAELSPMADLLRSVEPVEPAGELPAEATVTQLIRRRAASQRYRARWQRAAGVAAGLVFLAGGIAVGIAAAPRGGQPGPAGQLHSAASASAVGRVGLVAKAWGTKITLDLSKVHGPLNCDLVAVSKSGERQVALSWTVPVPGDGVPGHPAHLVIDGGTGIALKNLARIDIDVVNGPTLLSIPV
jgi:hypothetical protein